MTSLTEAVEKPVITVFKWSISPALIVTGPSAFTFSQNGCKFFIISSLTISCSMIYLFPHSDVSLFFVPAKAIVVTFLSLISSRVSGLAPIQKPSSG